ncbi:bone marrow stromal antigen 2 isoform 1-T2 [Dugong dugon]
MDDKWGKAKVGGVLLLVMALVVPLIIIVNSKTCKDGLEVQKECQNATHLKRQLTQAQEGFWEAQAQADACNHTVVNLTASLEVEKAQGQKKQALVEELKEEIKKLNQTLQEKMAEVEQLRKEEEARGNSHTSSSSTTLSPSVAAGLLQLLGLITAVLL